MHLLNSTETLLVGGGWHWAQGAGFIVGADLTGTLSYLMSKQSALNPEPVALLLTVTSAAFGGIIGSLLGEGLWYWNQNQKAEYNCTKSKVNS
ncbi:MAG: hypothetical protein ACHQJ6_08405 [Candidatus Berkiellales bacterium]